MPLHTSGSPSHQSAIIETGWLEVGGMITCRKVLALSPYASGATAPDDHPTMHSDVQTPYRSGPVSGPSAPLHPKALHLPPQIAHPTAHTHHAAPATPQLDSLSIGLLPRNRASTPPSITNTIRSLAIVPIFPSVPPTPSLATYHGLHSPTALLDAANWHTRRPRTLLNACITAGPPASPSRQLHSPPRLLRRT